MEATLVIPNWKRPHHLPRIIDNALPVFDEILIVNNSPLPFHDDRVRVLDMPHNRYTYSRAIGARAATHRIVATQDDDCLPLNWTELLDRFDGQRITANLADDGRSRHWIQQAHKVPFIQLGWGSVHLRRWFSDSIRPWIETHGSDHLLIQKFDRIYTVLHGRHDPVRATSDELARLNDSGREALYRQPGHSRQWKRAVRMALEIKADHDSHRHTHRPPSRELPEPHGRVAHSGRV